MNELQATETEIVGQRTLFDYASLDAETRIVVQQRAGEIKGIAKRMAADVVEIGEKLADVKQRLGANGRFNDWLSAELGWSPRTAHNFIGVWRRFGSANFAIENVAVSALYALAAPSTPLDAIEEVKQIADGGERVTHTRAEEIIEEAKAKRPKQVELVEEPEEPEPKLEEDEDDDAPATIYNRVEQDELDEMDTVCASDRISQSKPIGSYYYDGARLVITATVS